MLSQNLNKKDNYCEKKMMRLLKSVTHKVMLPQVLELMLQPFDNLYLAVTTAKKSNLVSQYTCTRSIFIKHSNWPRQINPK